MKQLIDVYETVKVHITGAAVPITQFTYKPNANNIKCVGIDFNIPKNLSLSGGCYYNARVGLSFNNQKGQTINQQVLFDDNGDKRLNRFLTINQPIEKNNLITGFVRDTTTVIGPMGMQPYDIYITFKMLRYE